ncbi:thioredoxin domain-containing protein [Sporolactobacillus sp. THM7-7]|nr:thioredoxin domain-containing protein [Sporolactobacillus sp. THM7-7]
MHAKRKPNRLIHSKSPYLLQHAYNPVNWYEWGEEAFEKAKKEKKPVLVSIGYSTCHWCHVMAHESFEDEETARVINENYVAVKVDREERPDIDAVYMKVCQALTGQGGWPLHVFLTPDQKPFYAGTYFPKTSMYGRPGFKEILLSLKKQYDAKPDKIEEIGIQIVDALSERTKSEAPLSEGVLDQAFEQFSQSFDPAFGGFGQAPKFPSPHQLMFLLRYARWRKEDRAIEWVRRTLDRMAEGGIHDHIGGGFARYSVDEKWLVPHFEKMLYDQALLAIAYTEAFQVTRDSSYKKVVENIFAYCRRELFDPSGGFYCAEDADSEGVEGKYYVWSPEEVIQVLGEEKGKMFCLAYSITPEGNFEGKSIPNRIGSDLADLGEKYGMSKEELEQELETAKERLLDARNKRVHPHKDDKMLTSWNALMITALAKAGLVLQKKDYVNQAQSTLSFIETHLIRDGQLMARYRDGEAKYFAYQEDYAFLALACETLYQATFRPVYLEKMRHYINEMIRKFWDESDGGFVLYDQKNTRLVLQPKEAYDGAIPSGNSAGAYVLLLLSERTGENKYARLAEKLFAAFAGDVASYPPGYAFMLTALLFRVSGPKELVLLEGEKGEPLSESVSQLRHLFLPEVTIFAGDSETLKKINENFGIYSAIHGQTTYFLCEQFVCHQPATHIEQLIKQLKQN